MKKTSFLFFVFTLVLFVSEVLAQTPLPSPNPNAGAPIDGFSTLLLVAGVGYGIHRMRKTISTDTQPEN